MARDRQDGVTAVPERQPVREVWLETVARREVSADVDMSSPGSVGSVVVRISNGAEGTLEVEVRTRHDGLWDANSAGRRVFWLGADGWATLHALQQALDSAIGKAQEVGWCDIVAKRHGVDVDEEEAESGR